MQKQDMTVFSPNMLKMFQTCPAKFYYRYIEQIPAPFLDKNFIFGKNIHAMASYYLKGEDIAVFEKSLSPKELKIWNELKSNEFLSYEIIGVEKNVLSKLGEYWLGGRIDAIVKKENDYYILDYKTGGVKDDMIYAPQTMVYLIVCDSMIQEYETLSFVYIDLKNNKEDIIRFTQELKEEYSKRLLKLCGEITEFDISKYKTDMICKCEYEAICTSYQN